MHPRWILVSFVLGWLSSPDAAQEGRAASGAPFGTAPPLRRVASVQVNVDSHGANIPGDAANEPSLAVDPRNTGRMAIGWRQFDDVASDFRQAGWGFSADGGARWTFLGVLDPGVLRTDPVLESDAAGVFYYNSLTTSDFTCDVFRSVDGGATWGAPVSAFGGDKSWMTIDRTRGLGHGNLYCAWNFTGCCGLDTFNRSTDGGATFSTPVPVPEIPQFGTLAVGVDGEVYVAGVGFDVSRFFVARSSNAKDPSVTPTFDFVRQVNLGGSLLLSGGAPNPEGAMGQVWIAVDHSNRSTRGWVYLLASVDPSGPDPCDVRFARSTDGGLTWSPSQRINKDPRSAHHWQWFGMLGCAPDGRIDVLWNDTSRSNQDNLSELHYSVSVDGGDKWSPSVPVTPLWNSHLGWPSQRKIGDYYDLDSDSHALHVAYAATFHGEQDVYCLRVDY